MFPTPIRRAAVIALSAAATLAAPAAADALPLELKARSTDDSVRYELTNKSPYPTNRIYFRAPQGAKIASTDQAGCEQQDNMVFCDAVVAPNETKTVTAKGTGVGPGTQHEACATAEDPPVSGCTTTTSERLETNPPKTDPPPPPTTTPDQTPKVAEPPPAANAVNVDLRQLLSCRCEKIVVGAVRTHNKRGKVTGAEYSTISDDRGKHRAGFTLRTKLECTAGVFPDACFGQVDIKAPKGIKIDKNRRKVACVGHCGSNPTKDTFIRMSGKTATERTDPVTFEITTTCADGSKETTDITFAFDRRGNVDWRRSDLGEALDAPPKPVKAKKG